MTSRAVLQAYSCQADSSNSENWIALTLEMCEPMRHPSCHKILVIKYCLAKYIILEFVFVSGCRLVSRHCWLGRLRKILQTRVKFVSNSCQTRFKVWLKQTGSTNKNVLHASNRSTEQKRLTAETGQKYGTKVVEQYCVVYY